MVKSTLVKQIGQVETEEAGEALRAFLRDVVRDTIAGVMAEEVVALCGPKHAQGQHSSAKFVRGGSAVGWCVVDGKKERIVRPRVRERSGDTTREKVLHSYAAAKDADEVRRQILLCYSNGVSTRSMSKVLPDAPGTSRSEISRQWQTHGAQAFEKLRARDLAATPYPILLLDGIVLSDDCHAVAALGITADGRKEFLDFEIGASESFEVCSCLLARLVQRGFAPPENTRLLALLDGSEALRKGVLKYWSDAAIQRCLVHKERNIRSYLSRRHHAELSRLFTRLRKAQGHEAAMDAYGELDRFLASKNDAARNSLHEAGEELLTLHRLNVPATLNVNLLSTNAIENSFRNVRARTGRVTRWRAETKQASHWLAWALLEAERGFRRISGYRSLPALIAALSRPLSASPVSPEHDIGTDETP